MPKGIIYITTVALALGLSGCIYVGGEVDGNSWESQQRKNRQSISQLDIGQERSSVQMAMGTPDFSEAFTLDDDQYRVLYYRTQRKHHDSDTSKDETTPLVFKNERLLGWGHDTLKTLQR